jgi:AcrR family transcriptional regulator
MNAKEKLIETTRELLWERGYTATSPKVIQERSGVGQGSMYHHFKGKSDLALESVRKNALEMRTIAAERLAQGETALEKIKSFLLRPRNIRRGCRIGGLTQDPNLLADEDIRLVLQEAFQWLHSALVEVVREGQRNGDFKNTADASDLALTIAAVLQGAYVLSKASASDEPFYGAVNGLINLLEK